MHGTIGHPVDNFLPNLWHNPALYCSPCLSYVADKGNWVSNQEFL